MKCFSLKSMRFVTSGVTPMGVGPRVTFVHENYPPAEAGLELSASDRCLVIGGERRIPASDELLALSPDTGAIKRDGHRVIIYRASLERRDGQYWLVPEKEDDREKALVYVDIGGTILRFERKPGDPDFIERVTNDDLGLHDEKILAVLEPFKPLTAVRSSKRWVFWGKESVNELLPIKFDGDTLFYEIVRP